MDHSEIPVPEAVRCPRLPPEGDFVTGGARTVHLYCILICQCRSIALPDFSPPQEFRLPCGHNCMY